MSKLTLNPQSLIKGFTLIEILIALFIFAIIAALATQSLHTVIKASERTEIKSKQLKELQFAMTLMQRDLQQAINRSILDPSGQRLPAFNADGLKYYLEFTHGGLINPLAIENRSTLERVAYLISKGKLIRRTWPVLDRSLQTKADNRVLLNNIESAKIEFLDQNNHWQKAWPIDTGNQQQIIPQAIRLIINIKNFGLLTRIFVTSITSGS